MIRNLIIKNFKIHANTALELKNLNILTGINGVGKSSIIQSLLLLRQSYEANLLSQGLQLNMPHCNIGLIKDAIYQGGETDEICFILDTDERNRLSWNFKPEDNDYEKNFIPATGKSPDDVSAISLFNDKFQYLSAARLSPRESYPLDTNSVVTKRRLSLEKGQGELAVHFLHQYGIFKKENIKSVLMKHKEQALDDLLSQTNAWEREISPGVNVHPIVNGKSFSLKYSFDKKSDVTNQFSAENVGYGLSYALPIIIAALSSVKGSLLLIENPEAHLHAKGQSKLAELLALAAQSGIQIILETHSEHILNGILVACKKFELDQKGIDKELVRIHHFHRDEVKHCAIVEPIKILDDGKIDKQPKDFFDQTETDLNFLLGF